MNNKDFSQDLINAQQRASVLQRRGKTLLLNEQDTENRGKPGMLARRKGMQDVFADKTSAVNAAAECKPSLLERRKKKLAIDLPADGMDGVVLTSVLQLPEESLKMDLEFTDSLDSSLLIFGLPSREDEKNHLAKRAAACLDAFNREVSEYVEYYKNFEVTNPINAFNMLPSDKDRYDPIHWAAINNDVRALEAFISYEVINTVDHRGRNALYFAAACGFVDSIKCLLENHDAKAQLDVLYNDLRHGYQILIPEILNIDGVKDIKGVKDFISAHTEYAKERIVL